MNVPFPEFTLTAQACAEVWKENSQTQYWLWSVPQVFKAHGNYTDEGTSLTRRFHRGTKLAFSWPLFCEGWVPEAWRGNEGRGLMAVKEHFCARFFAMHSYKQHVIPILEMRKLRLRLYNHQSRARMEPQAYHTLSKRDSWDLKLKKKLQMDLDLILGF